MKRIGPWIALGLGCLAVGLGVWYSQSQRSGMPSMTERPSVSAPSPASASATTTAPSEQQPQPAESTTAEGERVAHTFTDPQQLQAFEKLWQERQQTLWRMAILRSYWTDEQGALTDLSNQMATEYHLDPAKYYRLDASRRALIEQTNPEGAAVVPPAVGTEAAEPPAPSAADTVAHTFDTDEQVSEFGARWQQRQGILMKMMALESYWNQDEAELAKLNEQLVKEYQLDPNKFYYFDRERNALIEREAPPGPAPTAAQPPAPPQG